MPRPEVRTVNLVSLVACSALLAPLGCSGDDSSTVSEPSGIAVASDARLPALGADSVVCAGDLDDSEWRAHVARRLLVGDTLVVGRVNSLAPAAGGSYCGRAGNGLDSCTNVGVQGVDVALSSAFTHSVGISDGWEESIDVQLRLAHPSFSGWAVLPDVEGGTVSWSDGDGSHGVETGMVLLFAAAADPETGELFATGEVYRVDEDGTVRDDLYDSRCDVPASATVAGRSIDAVPAFATEAIAGADATLLAAAEDDRAAMLDRYRDCVSVCLDDPHAGTPCTREGSGGDAFDSCPNGYFCAPDVDTCRALETCTWRENGPDDCAAGTMCVSTVDGDFCQPDP